MIFRFADLFNQLYGFSTHLRGAILPIRPRFSASTAFTDTHYLSDGNALISVRVENDDDVQLAKKIYQDADAQHISVQSVVDASA